jgi:hypothetical protein
MMRSRIATLRAGLIAAWLLPLTARADGAFPDSMQILLPSAQPEELILGTNFGLVRSEDGGRRWSFLCEAFIAAPGETIVQYQLGPAPGHALFARSSDHVSRSGDHGCSWTAAEGPWANLTDLFVDPAAAGHLYALALAPDASGTLASTLLESRDAGQSFVPVYRAAEGIELTGVENAVAAPATIYLSATVRVASGGVQPRSFRSMDGGKSFQESDLGATLGAREPRIAAVDPVDPRLIYYRMIDVSGDQLAISRDGGQTATLVLRLEEDMSAFLRRSDGTLLVATIGHGGHLSHDGGKNFARWVGAPHLRGLGERAGVLYGVADNGQDGFAIGASSDGGASWTPVLRFTDICEVAACSDAVARACQGPLVTLMSLVGAGASCARSVPEAPPDAAVRDAAVQDAATVTTKSPSACATGGRSGWDGWWLLAAVTVAAHVRRRRPARR